MPITRITAAGTCRVLVDADNAWRPTLAASYHGIDPDLLRQWAQAYGRPELHWFQARRPNITRFFNRVRSAGIQVHTKDPKELPGGKRKGDMDGEIFVTALSAEPVDTVILVSGDGDFEPLVVELARRGVRIVVVAGRDYLAPELAQHVDPDDLIDLEAFLAICGYRRWEAA